MVYEARDGVAVVTLNRPDNRNSMTQDLLRAFRNVLQQVNAQSPRCLVITGRGSCFCAGADVRESLQAGSDDLLPHERSMLMYEPFLSVLDVSVPVVAAINGHAVGGGFGLALLADIRVGNVSAKYGANFVRLGIHSGMGISHTLPLLVGAAAAAEMLLTGGLIDGERAHRLGILNHAVPADEVMPVAENIARQIASAAPIPVRTIKQTLSSSRRAAIRDAARREAQLQAETLQTADAKEGMSALLEKRPPSFLGH